MLFVIEIERLISEDRYKNESTEDFRKDFPDEIEKLEEALNNYISENDLKILKTEFPENGIFFEKLAYPCE